MKTKHKKWFAATAICLLSLSTLAQNDYVAHEWGTFTSVQGGDGELLPWRPLRTSELPGFVYNWNKAGLNRLQSGQMALTKGEMVTLQRMETPVIYFYANNSMNLDVGVGFPKGIITEWYPQATQIGPSVSRSTNTPAVATTGESRAVWKNLQLVTPVKNKSELNDQLPQDKSGSHYYAARETSSAFVQTEIPGAANNATETEKFIFYRGAGSFKTPLRVSVGDNIVLQNNGANDLSHLFLVSVHYNGYEKSAAFETMKNLAPNNSTFMPRLNPEQFQPLEKFQAEIAAQMESALVSQGLFPNEARAMVNTWKDSWFAEEGDRVFYILPRAWTDETLPMTLNPKPEKLVRVMVGRAEIITPKTVKDLSATLTSAANGDAEQRKLAEREIRVLGRFAEPALRLANLHNSSPEAENLSYQILFAATQSKFE
jgi:hypothetical protein